MEAYSDLGRLSVSGSSGLGVVGILTIMQYGRSCSGSSVGHVDKILGHGHLLTPAHTGCRQNWCVYKWYGSDHSIDV